MCNTSHQRNLSFCENDIQLMKTIRLNPVSGYLTHKMEIKSI